MRLLARPKVWKILQTGASLVNGPGNAPSRLRYRARCDRKCALNLRPRVTTNESPSGLQEPMKAPADLLMRQILAALQGVLAALHGLGEACFLLEIPRENVLHQLAGIAALLSGGLRELRFEFRREVYFHGLKIREKRLGGKLRLALRNVPNWILGNGNGFSS